MLSCFVDISPVAHALSAMSELCSHGGAAGYAPKILFRWTQCIWPYQQWHVCRPVESHNGAWKNIIAGPYYPPHHSVCLEIETPKASRGRKRGERCPLTIRLGVRGSVVSSRAPAENGFYAYFRSERSHLEHHFQYF